MDQVPQRPDRRPGVVTAVGVLMLIRGVFSILGGVLALTGGGYLVGYAGGVLIVFGFLFIGLGIVQVWAGAGILRLDERARMVGFVIAIASAVLTVLSLAGASGSSVVGLVIDGFIIWALYTNRGLFH